MPLANDAYAEISAPMLTCVQKNDGYQYELMVRVGPNDNPITKIKIGPYKFQNQYKPKYTLGGLLQVDGPENGFFMHVSSPQAWTRVRWEIAADEQDNPAYLVWEGKLEHGQVGIFRFISLYRPGGLKAGLTIYRGNAKELYGVTGPNYEPFEVHAH